LSLNFTQPTTIAQAATAQGLHTTQNQVKRLRLAHGWRWWHRGERNHLLVPSRFDVVGTLVDNYLPNPQSPGARPFEGCRD